jgi:putative transposase
MNERLNQYSMGAWCQGLQESRSGFCARRNRSKIPAPVDAQLIQAYAIHKGKAGAPSLCSDLRASGFCVSVRTVGRKHDLFSHQVVGWQMSTDINQLLWSTYI